MQSIGEEVEADSANDEENMHDRAVGAHDRRWSGEVAARGVHGCAANARGDELRSCSPLRPRGGAEAKLVPRADEIDDRSDLGALLTAATFALLPSAGES